MSLRKWLLAASAVTVVAACGKEMEPGESPEVQAAPEEVQEVSSVYVPGVVNVYFDDDMIALIEQDLLSGNVKTKSSSLNSALENLGIVSLERMFPEDPDYEDRHRAFGLHKWYRVSYNPSTAVTKASADLLDIPGVQVVRPVLRTTTGATFNDPMLSKQWGYENSSPQWADVNVVPVWEGYSTGDPGVIVSVVDGGIDLTHEDLADNVIPGGSDGSKNFMINNTGYRIVAHDHGTHVAGTIAAVNNNGKGVSGIAGGNLLRYFSRI